MQFPLRMHDDAGKVLERELLADLDSSMVSDNLLSLASEWAPTMHRERIVRRECSGAR